MKILSAEDIRDRAKSCVGATFGNIKYHMEWIARKAEDKMLRQIVEMLKEQQGHGVAGFYNQILIQTLELELKAEVEKWTK